MKTKIPFNDFVEEGPTNLLFYRNITPELAITLTKDKNLLNSNQERLQEIKERTKKISGNERSISRDFLFEALDEIKFYEEDFHNYNSRLKSSVRIERESPLEHSLEKNREGVYEIRLEKAEEYGADISGLPIKLDYLERRN